MSLSPRIAVSCVVLAMLAGCQVVPQTGGASPAPEPTPAPTPAPAAPAPAVPPASAAQVATPAPPAPSTPQSGESWEVAPVAPGDWRYDASAAGSVATFGSPAAPSLTLRCIKSQRQVAITLMRYGGSRLATIRTSAGPLEWSGVTQQTADGIGALVITRPANDPGLDRIAYSRGRISIEPAGAARFILPVVSEIGRVIEDCRS